MDKGKIAELESTNRRVIEEKKRCWEKMGSCRKNGVIADKLQEMEGKEGEIPP